MTGRGRASNTIRARRCCCSTSARRTAAGESAQAEAACAPRSTPMDNALARCLARRRAATRRQARRSGSAWLQALAMRRTHRLPARDANGGRGAAEVDAAQAAVRSAMARARRRLRPPRTTRRGRAAAANARSPGISAARCSNRTHPLQQPSSVRAGLPDKRMVDAATPRSRCAERRPIRSAADWRVLADLAAARARSTSTCRTTRRLR